MSYDPQNVFARILRGEISSHTVYEDEHTLCFMDAMPQSDGHVLVIPKYPATDLLELPGEHLQSLILVTQRMAKAAQRAFGADGIMVMQLNGAAAGQTVLHIHFHVIPRHHGRELVGHARNMAESAVLAEHARRLREALAAA